MRADNKENDMQNAVLKKSHQTMIANDLEEIMEAGGLKFTRQQIEDGGIIDEQGERIAAKIAESIYFTRYYQQNRVWDLSEGADIVEILFDRHDEYAHMKAMAKLAQYGEDTDWLFDEEIRPELKKLYNEIEEQCEELGWSPDLGEEWEFECEIGDLVLDIVHEKDDSKPLDLLGTNDRVEVAFILMPNASNVYSDDYTVYSHKAWADWEHLSLSQGLLESLPRLGYSLTEYRNHSGNKHERDERVSAYRKRRPIATLDQIKELVENACSAYFHFAIYAQVPLKQLLNLDLKRPVVLSEYSLCTYSDSGTFFDLRVNQPIVLNPEDGIWKSFGSKGPSDWCGLSNRYYQANIRN